MNAYLAVQANLQAVEVCAMCAAGTTSSSVQFVTGSDGQPTAAVLTGNGAQATFTNTAGQIVVVTSDSAGTTNIPITAAGNPTIPTGADVTVVSNNPSVPSTSASSPGTALRHSDLLHMI